MEERADKIKRITKELEEGIVQVYESDRYKEYLKFMGRFHGYSYRNTLLIMLQKPDASLVAGCKTWQGKLGRQVKKGEKGIAILAPAFKTKKILVKSTNDKGQEVETEEEVTCPRFKLAYVFDISQTEGKEIPTIGKELTLDVEGYEHLMASIKCVSPFPIEFGEMRGRESGYCSPVEKRIVLKEGMSQSQTIKTMVHEVAHAVLHAENRGLPVASLRSKEEVEAESIAFIVCNQLGIDSSDYSFDYIADWSSGQELKELKNSLNTIQKEAASLIDGIESKYRELRRQHEEMLDTVRFDNDIDLDKEKTREQLGFRDKDRAHETPKKKQSREAVR